LAKSNMTTSVVFGDDGSLKVTNIKRGDPRDKCHEDLVLLDEALTAGGAVLEVDEDLAPDEAVDTLGRVSDGVGQKPSRCRIRRQTKDSVQVCVEN